MKHFKILGITLILGIFGFGILGAQTPGRPLNGMSFNGSTGLYSIPSARIGWERPNRFGFDFGYHTIVTGGKATHIPKMNVSLFNWIEFHSAFDIQPDAPGNSDRGDDFILGAKIQLPLTTTNIAFGGNYQRLNLLNNNYGYNAGQVYIAISYPGRFFDNPAETTVVLGKTFVENYSDTDIDFGIGFNLMFLPQYLGGFVYWVTDYANFSYSVEPFGADSWYRGVINTGLRLDFSIIPAFRRIKFIVDLVITDAFDDNRAFSAGLVIGVPFL